MKTSDIVRFLDRCRGEVVGVVGDLMLDRFVWGRVSRISPEAPVPVVEVDREDYHLGGAANVARNVQSLGGEALLLGVAGRDEAGDLLLRALVERGLATESIVTDAARRTTVKTRIIAHSQQVVRTDWESNEDVAGEAEARALERLEDIVGRSKALVLSDYAKGALTPKLVETAIVLSRAREIPVLVDPKPPRYRIYRGATLLTPNAAEAERFTGTTIRSEAELERATREVLSELDCQAVLVTRGDRGMSLFQKGGAPFHIPASAREVFDVTGAGDTVIATAALALACGASFAEAAELSNRAGGIVVGKLGTATVLPEELLRTAGEETQ